MSLREEFKRFSGKFVSVTEMMERVKADIGDVDLTSAAHQKAILENVQKLTSAERRDIQQVQFYVTEKVANAIEKNALRGETVEEAKKLLMADLNGLATRKGVYADAFHLVAMMSLAPDKRISEAYMAAADACADHTYDRDTISYDRLLERVQERLVKKFSRR